MIRKLALTAFGALALAAPAANGATKHHRHHHHHATSSVRIAQSTISGRQVRVVSWRPGDRRIIAQVAYSAQHRTVPHFAHQVRRPVAAINGMTWRWATGTPTGILKAGGHMIHRRGRDHHPVVGFGPTGQVVFGARLARTRHYRNVIAGFAYLVRYGKPLRSRADAPYAGPTVFSCGRRGTDGPKGCFRSIVAQFSNGRAALIEIAFASMPAAAKILKRMHVTNAIVLDSGGSANEWDKAGKHGSCRGNPLTSGGCFGITRFMGGHQADRSLPDAIVLSLRAT